MRILVQKFGGSSVVTPELRQQVVEKVKNACAAGYTPVVVVSAMGRAGDPYATDTLINLARTVSRDIAPREMDLLMACGEIISGVIMVGTLEKAGLPAVMLTGGQAGITTDSNFNNARILHVDPAPILKHAREGKIVVVAGFQGMTSDGEITTLGRGGSDTTASALGVALNAAAVEIYTDVEGVMTADPRIVHNARILDVVSYNEVCQLAQQGAKVIHPRAVEIAMQKNIPLMVKCTFSDAPGTLITSRYDEMGGAPIADRPVIGIAQMTRIAQIKVNTLELNKHPNTTLEVFKAMAEAGISVDLINVVYPSSILFTVAEDVADKAAEILKDRGFTATVTRDCAKVSVVGGGMRGVPGVMAKFIEALTEEGIPVLQTVDSHTSISGLIRQEHVAAAVKSLHAKFGLGEN